MITETVLEAEPFICLYPSCTTLGHRQGAPSIASTLRALSTAGGQDEYGPYCGSSSFLSAVKRTLWVCGFGACLPAPGPVHQLVDRRILAFLRDKFNPLRHSDVSSKLPPPRRFRVNENFVTYGGDKKDKDVGTLGPYTSRLLYWSSRWPRVPAPRAFISSPAHGAKSCIICLYGEL